jgi:transposase-like protein
VLSFVRLVKGKPVNDTDALRKYHREYYHATKQRAECEHCKHTFTSQSAYVRHQRRNQKCALLRTQAELEMLRSGQAAKISEADV